jgi:hypothetical protein
MKYPLRTARLKALTALVSDVPQAIETVVLNEAAKHGDYFLQKVHEGIYRDKERNQYWYIVKYGKAQKEAT